MGSMNGINGAHGMGGATSTRGSLGRGFPQPGPTGSTPSTAYSAPPNWRDYPVDKRTGKVGRRAVGGAAGQNGLEEDGDLLIIESMGTLGRPFNPFQRDLQRFWADPLLRPAVRKRFWRNFDENARRDREMWEAVRKGRRGWLRRRR